MVKAEIGKKSSRLIFPNLTSLSKENLMEAINVAKGYATLAFDENPYIAFDTTRFSGEEILVKMTEFLQTAKKAD